MSDFELGQEREYSFTSYLLLLLSLASLCYAIALLLAGLFLLLILGLHILLIALKLYEGLLLAVDFQLLDVVEHFYEPVKVFLLMQIQNQVVPFLGLSLASLTFIPHVLHFKFVPRLLVEDVVYFLAEQFNIVLVAVQQPEALLNRDYLIGLLEQTILIL